MAVSILQRVPFLLLCGALIAQWGCIEEADPSTEYPPPALSTISPTSGPSAGGIMVMITGDNFVDGATVTFGGVAASAVQVNSRNQIVATLPPQPGKSGLVDVAVTNVGGKAGSIQQFSYYLSTVQFGPPKMNPVGMKTQFPLGRDVNGDGKIDLIYTDATANTLTVQLGKGDGTFLPVMSGASITTGGMGSGSADVADLNGDGKLDVVVSNNMSEDVSVLLGNGNGTFATAKILPIGGGAMELIVARDLTGDGIVDLVVASLASVNLLVGNGNGTFAAAKSIDQVPGAYGVVVADLSGDGRPDIAVTINGGSTVRVLISNGKGTFAPAQSFAVGSGPVGIVAADLNGDGRLDLACTNYFSASLSILLGNGDGTFKPAISIATGTGTAPFNLVALDLDGDSKLDLVTNLLGSNVSLFQGSGDGQFHLLGPVDTGTATVWLTTADFDGDGKADLAVTTGTAKLINVTLNISK